MKLFRYQTANQAPRVGLTLDDTTLIDLTSLGVDRLDALLGDADPAGRVEKMARGVSPAGPLSDVKLLPPVDQQEVWAVGVTYLRSKVARMEESDFSATAYDRVYDAERPELFFKALPEKVVGPGEPVGMRRDSRWSAPEPELALVLNSRGQIAGYTVGNDMTARDIEGDNLLYLPQAKIYDRSCAVGPFITVGVTEAMARTWRIEICIRRHGGVVFGSQTEVARIKRPFEEMARFLFRSQTLPHGAVLLTGTGIVPPDDFCIQAGDLVEINISGIGRLNNPVVLV